MSNCRWHCQGCQDLSRGLTDGSCSPICARSAAVESHAASIQCRSPRALETLCAVLPQPLKAQRASIPSIMDDSATCPGLGMDLKNCEGAGRLTPRFVLVGYWLALQHWHFLDEPCVSIDLLICESWPNTWQVDQNLRSSKMWCRFAQESSRDDGEYYFACMHFVVLVPGLPPLEGGTCLGMARRRYCLDCYSQHAALTD